MSERIKHTILMMERDGDAEATYNDVIWYEGLYGCLLRLHMEDDSEATFNNEEWLIFDLTPTRGWNPKATNELKR